MFGAMGRYERARLAARWPEHQFESLNVSDSLVQSRGWKCDSLTCESQAWALKAVEAPSSGVADTEVGFRRDAEHCSQKAVSWRQPSTIVTHLRKVHWFEDGAETGVS
jgi:hypothetical protein